MRSTLSPIIVDIVLCDLEESVFNTLKLRLPFYYRYVDDIVLASRRRSI